MTKNNKIVAGVIAVIILGLITFYLYKNFFTYQSYTECVGDRTLKSGMSKKQIYAQEDYCRSYFYQRLSAKEKKEVEERVLNNLEDLFNCETKLSNGKTFYLPDELCNKK